MQGCTDIPLNATGRDQARSAGAALLAAGEQWDVVVSSPLDRARETAEIIAETLGVALGDSYDGLVEQDFGEAEGLLVVDAVERWPDRIYPNMEQDAAVGVRGAEALRQVDLEHSQARVLAVAHGTLIRRTLSVLSGHPFERFPRLENASVSRVRRGAERWVVETVGDAPFEQVLQEA